LGSPDDIAVVSDSPPLSHLDFSPIAAVAGATVLAAVAASLPLGANGPVELAVAVAAVAAPLVALAVALSRRL
jgi:hypothetical protein